MVKAKKIPDKTTLNLVMREHPENSPRRVVPLFIALAVIVLLFARFAVIGPLMAVAAANNAADRAEDNLALVKAYTADYDAVSSEYARYSNGGLTDDELSLADRLDVLSLAENALMKYGRIESLTVAGNTVTVKISDVTLDEVSDIILSLDENDLVSGVNVSNADTMANSVKTSITMTITLKSGGDAK